MNAKQITLPKNYQYNVFINCPFDAEYKPLFDSMIFTIIACGFIPRCAREQDDSGDIRIKKIVKIIEECKFGIHDLSRFTGSQELPRFNMPLELGIFMGCHEFGASPHNVKNYLILDSKDFRYQAFISDLGGQDIKSHGDTSEGVIRCIREWLGSKRKHELPHASFLQNDYNSFQEALPELCETKKWTPAELSFNEFTLLATTWVNTTSNAI
ncbi:MAG: hypothetical protein ACOVSW_05420 [Candidatus Kapaibacteriota bacterium]